MTIQAIQTRYAGCYFRSRLEARWAVFFDAMRIRWQYEPQGILVSKRLEPWSDDPPRPYLPDFLLPDLALWVEVKGHLTPDELWTILNDAASLSSNDGSGCHDQGGLDLLLAGPIPRLDMPPRAPVRLHLHKGMLVAYPWEEGDRGDGKGGCGSHTGFDVASDSGETLNEPHRWILDGYPTIPFTVRERMAYLRASEARFEFGETPESSRKLG